MTPQAKPKTAATPKETIRDVRKALRIAVERATDAEQELAKEREARAALEEGAIAAEARWRAEAASTFEANTAARDILEGQVSRAESALADVASQLGDAKDALGGQVEDFRHLNDASALLHADLRNARNLQRDLGLRLAMVRKWVGRLKSSRTVWRVLSIALAILAGTIRLGHGIGILAGIALTILWEHRAERHLRDIPLSIEDDRDD